MSDVSDLVPPDITSINDEDELRTQLSIKRKKNGRIRDLMKLLRATTHEMGPDCKCKRYRCFEVLSEEQRIKILKDFNHMRDYNTQNVYLSSLVTVSPVARRRNRTKGVALRSNFSSYSYRVRVTGDNEAKDVQVCYKGFMSVHGITAQRIQRIRESLVSTGLPPVDGRGSHSNRPHKLSDETVTAVKAFIKSLEDRKMHHSLTDSEKLYCPEDLNIKKMWTMFSELNPDKKLSYESFRTIFENDLSMPFWYSSKDTYSTYDSLNTEVNCLAENLHKEMEDQEKLLEALQDQSGT